MFQGKPFDGNVICEVVTWWIFHWWESESCMSVRNFENSNGWVCDLEFWLLENLQPIIPAGRHFLIADWLVYIYGDSIECADLFNLSSGIIRCIQWPDSQSHCRCFKYIFVIGKKDKLDLLMTFVVWVFVLPPEWNGFQWNVQNTYIIITFHLQYRHTSISC